MYFRLILAKIQPKNLKLVDCLFLTVWGNIDWRWVRAPYPSWLRSCFCCLILRL